MTDQQQQPSEASRKTARVGLATINNQPVGESTVATKAIAEMAYYIDQDKADLVDSLHEALAALDYQRMAHDWRDKERRAKGQQAIRDAGSMAAECEEQVGNARQRIEAALARHDPNGASSDDT